jgi:predicted amidohydrolase YtcJ
VLERPVLFRGGTPEVASGADGRILGVGAAATAAAGPQADVVELEGRVHPGFHDSHIHLGWMARHRMTLDLTGAAGVADVVDRVRRRASGLPVGAWVVGHHLDDSDWTDRDKLDRRHLEAASPGRPVFIHRRDTHLAWVSSEALAIAGIDRDSVDPAGGVIDRDSDGEPSGVVRDQAAELVRRHIPEIDAARRRQLLGDVCSELSRLGVTSVHAVESVEDFELLGSLHAAGLLHLRVSALLPHDSVDDLVAAGVRSGHGDDSVRVWGVKLFLDGSLGSDTAEMLDGRGIEVLPQKALRSVVARTADAGLNLAIHAIGDGAVRRCLDALEERPAAHPLWRPRIEHAQCVDSEDASRFAQLGVIASMQPIHAVSDRTLADRRWGDRCANAYAWRLLHDAGALLAFGSDAPVDDPAPLRGIAAATHWRRTAGWYPQLALDGASAVQAYTANAAYAVGMEDRLGTLAPGSWCDLTVVRGDVVIATVLAGEVVSRALAR